MHKILLPVALRHTALRVVHQAAALARHYHAEIILLHVLSPLSYPAGVLKRGHKLTERDLRAGVIKRAQKDLNQLLRAELEGIAVRRLLFKGNPARVIAQTARDEKVDLIAMSTRRHGVLYHVLKGSVTAKVLHYSDCPVWTGTCVAKTPACDVTIRNVLCAVDLSPHSRSTVSRAAQLAAEFGAQLTLFHVTAGVEIYGPGGLYVLPKWREQLVGAAAKEIAKLQPGPDTEAIIDSGDVLELVNRAAEQVKSDLLVIGHLPPGDHLGPNSAGYAIISKSDIPVLRV